MNTETSQTYDWLRTVSKELFQLDEVPLLGYPPSFSWEKFSAELKNILHLPHLEIKPSDTQWRTEEELLAGLGDPLVPLNLNINPLEGPLFWVISEQDLRFLLMHIAAKGGDITPIIDEDFEQGFYHFLAVEAIQALEKAGFDHALSPQILKTTALPQETALCQDVTITINNKTICGRIFISSKLRTSWAQHYAQKQDNFRLKSAIAKQATVPVHLEVGKFAIAPVDWAQVANGDFIMLDTCSLRPEEKKGRVMMTISGVPFFRARIKGNKLKILEHPLYHELEANMEKDLSEEEFDESDFEDEESEFEDEESEFEDEDSEDEETELDEEEELEDVNESEEDEEVAHPIAEDEEEEVPTPAPIAKEKEITSPDQIPMSVVVEIGRLQMSVQKLMELQPGNLLELDVRPEDGVQLVVNGKPIAKAELLRVGDVLGVRILDLG